MREEHGPALSKGYCRVRELITNAVRVTVWSGERGYSAQSVDVSVEEARYIASKLRRLARRIEERKPNDIQAG